MSANPFIFLALFAAAALGFALAPLAIAWLWARAFSLRKPSAVKNAIYECGLDAQPTGPAYLAAERSEERKEEALLRQPVGAKLAFEGIDFDKAP